MIIKIILNRIQEVKITLNNRLYKRVQQRVGTFIFYIYIGVGARLAGEAVSGDRLIEILQFSIR